MGKTLLATTAVAAVVGCTALAMAQTGAPQQRGGQTQMTPAGTAPPASSNATIPERLEPGQGVSPAPQGQSTPQHGAQQAEPSVPGAGSPQQQTGQAQPKSGEATKLSQAQRSKIKGILAKDRSAHVDHATFSVTVGAVIPKSVHITVVPQDIVTVVPEYQGFDYVMVGDEILIVNPDTLRIVAIISA